MSCLPALTNCQEIHRELRRANALGLKRVQERVRQLFRQILGVRSSAPAIQTGRLGLALHPGLCHGRLRSGQRREGRFDMASKRRYTPPTSEGSPGLARSTVVARLSCDIVGRP
jgi:hypothetical protein